MKEQELKELVKQGFAAMKAGSKVAADATDEIQDAAKNTELKNALKEGNEKSKIWLQRIDRALEEAGGSAEEENEILKAHYEVSKKIRDKAPDDDTRDLGIIASGQLAIHYWIAAFGTQLSYASQAGLSQAQQDMQACLDEAKNGDDEHTKIAKSILQAM